MAAPIPSATELSVDSVKSFLIEKGGEVTSTEFVKYFKNILMNPDKTQNAEEQQKFKAITKKLAKTAVIDEVTYVKLRSKFMPKKEECREKDNASVSIDQSSTTSGSNTTIDVEVPPKPIESIENVSKNNTAPECEVQQDASHVEQTNEDQISVEATVLETCNSEPKNNDPVNTEDVISPRDVNEDSTSSQTSTVDSKTSEVVEDETNANISPVAPPRKKHSQKWKRDVPLEETKENISQSEAANIAVSINVKEQAKKLNKIESESQLINRTPGNGNKKRENKLNDDEDNHPTFPLNAATRDWIVKAAKADYMALIGLLKDNPGLAKHKDFIWGYNALHWAAKHGNCDVIKLIAGTHNVNVNIRSNGGLTPLHLAAMFQRKEAYELLSHTYRANVELRDYSGKKASDYWKKLEPNRSSRTTSNSSKGKYNPYNEDYPRLVRSTSNSSSTDGTAPNASIRRSTSTSNLLNSPSLPKRLRQTALYNSFRRLNRPKVVKQPRNPNRVHDTYRPIADDHFQNDKPVRQNR